MNAPAMDLRLTEKLARLMNSSAPILLWGERGTGKTTLARLLHHHHRSRRRHEPFVVVDCANIPEPTMRAALCGVLVEDGRVPGLLDAVGAGSILFEGIDRGSFRLQSTVRDVLDNGAFRPNSGHERIPFRGRVLATAAAMPSLDTMVPGLYYHLFKLRQVPLRDRPELESTVRELLRRAAVAARRSFIEDFSCDAMGRVLRYPWPGNFAELNHALDLAVHRCDVPLVRVADLPAEVIAHGAASLACVPIAA